MLQQKDTAFVLYSFFQVSWEYSVETRGVPVSVSFWLTHTNRAESHSEQLDALSSRKIWKCSPLPQGCAEVQAC